jgi:hypothetical protein
MINLDEIGPGICLSQEGAPRFKPIRYMVLSVEKPFPEFGKENKIILSMLECNKLIIIKGFALYAGFRTWKIMK